MDPNVNAWQETLHNLLKDRLIEPKRVALRLHRHSDYLNDICRRDRVDPFAVFNAILVEAQQFATIDPQRMLAIAGPIAALLTVGTRFYVAHAYPNVAAPLPSDLRTQVPAWLRDVAGVVESLYSIERDGKLDAEDDPDIAEFDFKLNRLVTLLHRVSNEVHSRRARASA